MKEDSLCLPTHARMEMATDTPVPRTFIAWRAGHHTYACRAARVPGRQDPPHIAASLLLHLFMGPGYHTSGWRTTTAPRYKPFLQLRQRYLWLAPLQHTQPQWYPAGPDLNIHLDQH